MTKHDWTALFRATGLSDEQMWQWHQLFEQRHPDDHGRFLAWLGIEADEIAAIRAKARSKT